MEIITSQDQTMCFRFDVIDSRDVSNLKFYTNGGKNMLVVFVKQGSMYLSVSHDYGQSFDQPEKMMDLAGEIKDVQMLMQNDQFVIAVQERISGEDHKRTISGWVSDDKTFSFKLCPKHEVKGELLNISLSFREVAPGKYESVDHLFFRSKDDICVESMGHPCKINLEKT